MSPADPTPPPAGAPPLGPGTGTFAPRPGAAPLPRMIAAQTALETRLLLRHGEQLLLTVVIPALALLLFATVDILALPDAGSTAERTGFLAPGVLALAAFATAFTGQAIATGYERRYGVLKRLGATPLPRWGLLAGKTGAVLVTLALQSLLLIAIALALGWSPEPGGAPAALLLLLLGTTAFSALGLLMAGTLRAEATLAGANLVFVVLLLCGDVIVPLENFPGPVREVLGLLPLTALADGLRRVLQEGGSPPWGSLAVLAVWAVAATAAAARAFRWE
ncbi:ABC transporter permease [Streptomyces aidingensis]|uniref:ABC-2 type transport system permease protein n=1 Tax=Streptomyces aidingensis TaxID=910347 RepID=A0A1I1M6P6_9ACTN|nr:ABC transporter permease [Streptomyces aidingensis]SFC81071.1 ABC-2 type transport system permease protein [Streptomyces aidingensis]